MSERRPLLAVLALLGVAVLVLLVAWLAQDRPFLASVPQPPPLAKTDLIAVRGGQTACLRDVTLVPRGTVATVHIGTRGKPAVPLRWTASGPGYRAQGDIAPTWSDNSRVPATITPPRAALRGAFCLRNGGRRAIDLYAASGDSQTVSRTDVDGRRAPANYELALSEAAPRSIASRAGTIAGATAAFRPATPWFVWLVGILAVLGLPGGLAFALWRASAERGA